MPLFEFHCNACGKDSEVLVRSSDWKGTECPKCGSTKLVKKLSVFAASSSPASGHSHGAMPCGLPPGAGGCCGGACGMN